MSDKQVEVVWKSACAHLQEVLRPDVFSRWIAVITPKSFVDQTLTLEVDNDFYQTWLEDNYLSLIKQAVATICDFEPQIQFGVRAQKPSAGDIPPSPSKRSIRRPFRRTATQTPTLNAKFTFDSFIVGPSNNFVHAAALAVAQAPARAYNPLFIYGGVGLGKTHIMQAIGHHVLNTSRATVCYLSSEAFTNEYIDALQNRALVQFRKKYRNTDLLLVDDIHFLAGKERLQEEFFHTFNALFDAHKQIVMTSDRPASEITRLEQRLVSRFEWGLVTEVQPPDLETRIAILRNKQDLMKEKIADELIQFIAQNIRSNIRRLEGALVRAVSYSSLTGREVSLDTLKYLLRDTLDQEQEEEVSFEKIQRAVADYFDVRLSDMTSKRKPRAIAVPRQIAMYLCRRMTRSSLPDIGNAFGKTHATVLHAYKTIDNRMEMDPTLQQDVAIISQRLGRSLVSHSTDNIPVSVGS